MKEKDDTQHQHVVERDNRKAAVQTPRYSVNHSLRKDLELDFFEEGC